MEASRPDGYGVLGRRRAETGIATGVWAVSYSIDGRGVTGMALSTSGSAHGVLGQTASPGGGALVGVNLANGPDLILDGVAAGATTTVLREGSLERASGSAESFDVRNSGGGGMTLTVAGDAGLARRQRRPRQRPRRRHARWHPSRGLPGARQWQPARWAWR